jgi:hypothetical protein
MKSREEIAKIIADGWYTRGGDGIADAIAGILADIVTQTEPTVVSSEKAATTVVSSTPAATPADPGVVNPDGTPWKDPAIVSSPPTATPVVESEPDHLYTIRLALYHLKSVKDVGFEFANKTAIDVLRNALYAAVKKPNTKADPYVLSEACDDLGIEYPPHQPAKVLDSQVSMPMQDTQLVQRLKRLNGYQQPERRTVAGERPAGWDNGATGVPVFNQSPEAVPPDGFGTVVRDVEAEAARLDGENEKKKAVPPDSENRKDEAMTQDKTSTDTTEDERLEEIGSKLAWEWINTAGTVSERRVAVARKARALLAPADVALEPLSDAEIQSYRDRLR